MGQGVVVYVFFIIMASLMSFSLFVGVRRQNRLEQGLLENNKEISEDDKKRLETEVQKLTDEKIADADKLAGARENWFADVPAHLSRRVFPLQGVTWLVLERAPRKETETLAFLRAIESLMPSPTKQTDFPVSISLLMRSALFWGKVSAK